MATNNQEITLKDLKEKYIMPALAGVPYRFKLFVNSGAYQKTKRAGNLRKGTINAFLQVTDRDVMLLGGGVRAVALEMTLSFLVPVPDEANEEGDYVFLDEFRENVANAFVGADKFELTVGGKTYIGAVSTSFPLGEGLEQRQGIGKSIEYTCYFEFSYLPDAINARDVKFYLDGDSNPLPVTSFSFLRRNTMTANLYSTSDNGESKGYAENSVFGVDLTLPSVLPNASVSALAIYNYLFGISSANTPHMLVISINGNSSSHTVIFGEASKSGGGIDNVGAKISFVPYLAAEDEMEG